MRVFYEAGIVSRRLMADPFDLVFSVNHERLAFVRADCPKIYYGDATPPLLFDSYRSFQALAPLSKFEGEYLFRKMLNNSAQVAFPGCWAVDSCRKSYGRETGIAAIPWGPSLFTIPKVGELRFATGASELHVVFIASDWERKGGDVALRSVIAAQAHIPLRLSVVGKRPSVVSELPGVKYLGYLDKNNVDDAVQLDALYREADVMILPSRADCYPVSIAEAMAYGIPVIASATGGIPEMLQHRLNGLVLGTDACVDDYAALLVELWTERETYEKLARASRQSFEDSWNWSSWAKGMQKLFAECAKISS